MYGNNPYQSYQYQGGYSAPSYMQRGYAPQPQPMAQPQPQVQPQPQMPMAQPMDMPIQDIKFVNRAQAEAYIVFPNTKVMLVDKESGMVYLKTADGMGQTQTDYFRFDRVNADGSPIKPQEPIPQVNFDEFIKKEDLEKFGFVTIEQYNALSHKMEQIQKQMEGVRQNVGKPKQS